MKPVEPVRLIVGLGNPGAEYESTRHNAGVWYINALLKRYPPPTALQNDSKFKGLTGQTTIGSKTVRLLIPTTFMNLSGQSVAALANFYKIPVESILVAHDELDIDPGLLKLKSGGGHGGHNGLKDIIAKAGKDFVRLRFGIGHPPTKQETNAWVIKKPNPQEKQGLEESFAKADSARDSILEKKWLIAMNELHKK